MLCENQLPAHTVLTELEFLQGLLCSTVSEFQYKFIAKPNFVTGIEWFDLMSGVETKTLLIMSGLWLKCPANNSFKLTHTKGLVYENDVAVSSRNAN